MQSSNETPADGIDYQLVCKVENIKVITNILSCLLLSKNETMATFECRADGIEITVEEKKMAQAKTLLKKELFQEYIIDGNNTLEKFRINLSLMMECLNIFGNSNSNIGLQIAWQGIGTKLWLIMVDDGITTECQLRTIISEQLVDFNFTGSAVTNKSLLKSESLKDAFNELDWSQAYMTIVMSPDPPNFRISTTGPQGSCQVDYPREAEAFETFESRETQTLTFKLEFLKPCIKALSHATKTQLRLNERGILCLKHMIMTEDKQNTFVDFLLLPSQDDDDDRDDD